MTHITFHLTPNPDWVLVEFAFEGALEPADLKTIALPELQAFYGKGVVISGRGPIWLYGVLIHHFHPTRFVATHDPRLQAAVIVEAHHPGYAIGDLIPM